MRTAQSRSDGNYDAEGLKRPDALEKWGNGEMEKWSNGDILHDQDELADMLAAFEHAVRLGGGLQRKRCVDHRRHGAGFEEGPDALAQSAGDGALFGDRPMSQRRAGDRQSMLKYENHVDGGDRPAKRGD